MINNICCEAKSPACHALLDAGLEPRKQAHVVGVQIQPPGRRPRGGEEGGLDGEDGEAESERQPQQQRHRRPPLRQRCRPRRVGPRHRRTRRGGSVVGGGASVEMGGEWSESSLLRY
uniref:Stv3 n=1 Tax=Arundo donax TaxID=35708 RepID=A0A0A9EL11_ARUDO